MKLHNREHKAREPKLRMPSDQNKIHLFKTRVLQTGGKFFARKMPGLESGLETSRRQPDLLFLNKDLENTVSNQESCKTQNIHM